MEKKYNSYRDIKVKLKGKTVREHKKVPIPGNGICKKDIQNILDQFPDDAPIYLAADYGYYGDLEDIYLDCYWDRPETAEEIQARTIVEQKKQYGKYLRSIGEL